MPSVSRATASFHLRDSATASKVLVVVSINKFRRTDDPHAGVTIHQIDPIKTRFSLVVGQMLEIPTDNEADSMRGGNGDMAGVINVFYGKHPGLDVSTRQFFGAVGQGQEGGVIWESSGEEPDNIGWGERSFLLGHNRGHKPAMA